MATRKPVRPRAARPRTKAAPPAETPAAGVASAVAAAAPAKPAMDVRAAKADRPKAKRKDKKKDAASARAAGKPGKAAKEKAKAVRPDPHDSAKREKLIRDSFTMPESDYALIAALKARALAAGFEVKKSELLRGGLLTLSRMATAQLAELVAVLPKIKTGRPNKKKHK
jgi:hypothetical protein